MKKLIVPAAIIFMLELATGWLVFKIIVGEVYGAGLGATNFTGQTNFWPLGLLAFITLPVVIGKMLSDALSHKISWKNAIVIYAAILALEITVSLFWAAIRSADRF